MLSLKNRDSINVGSDQDWEPSQTLLAQGRTLKAGTIIPHLFGTQKFPEFPQFFHPFNSTY